MKKSGLIAVSLVLILPLLAIFGGCGEDSTTCTCDQSALEEAVTALETQVADQQAEITALQTDLTTAEGNINNHDGRLTTVENNNALLLDPYLTISSATTIGLAGPHVILEGVNLHIRNGSGATTIINGVGNLLVGYNEEPPTLNPGDRGGSHNLIVGPEHRYLSYGGFVAGYRNTVSNQYSSVSGGWQNTASGWYSSVSGGGVNEASEGASSVSGGYDNTAIGWYSSVSGGDSRSAPGDFDWAAGNLWEND